MCSTESSVVFLDFRKTHNHSKESPESSVVIMDFNETQNHGEESPESSVLVLDFDDSFTADSGLCTLKPSCASTPLIQKTAPSEAVVMNAVRRLSFAQGEVLIMSMGVVITVDHSLTGVPRVSITESKLQRAIAFS